MKIIFYNFEFIYLEKNKLIINYIKMNHRIIKQKFNSFFSFYLIFKGRSKCTFHHP